MTELSAEAAFAAALVEFQKAMPSITKTQTAKVKTKSGVEYSYDFADLADVTEILTPLLTAQGLAWTAVPTTSEAGFVLRCTLLHVAGYRETGDYPLPDPAQHSPQEIGSAITYARRYALTSLTGVAPSGADDDGQKASGARAASPQPVSALTELKREIVRIGKQIDMDTTEMLSRAFAAQNGGLVLADATETELQGFLDWLLSLKADASEHRKQIAAIFGETLKGETRKDNPQPHAQRSDGPTPEDAAFETEPVTV